MGFVVGTVDDGIRKGINCGQEYIRLRHDKNCIERHVSMVKNWLVDSNMYSSSEREKTTYSTEEDKVEKPVADVRAHGQ